MQVIDLTVGDFRNRPYEPRGPGSILARRANQTKELHYTAPFSVAARS